jgi:hypothetical protein
MTRVVILYTKPRPNEKLPDRVEIIGNVAISFLNAFCAVKGFRAVCGQYDDLGLCIEKIEGVEDAN